MTDPKTVNRIFASSFFAPIAALLILGIMAWHNAPSKSKDINAVLYPSNQDEQKAVAIVVPAVR